MEKMLNILSGVFCPFTVILVHRENTIVKPCGRYGFVNNVQWLVPAVNAHPDKTLATKTIQY